MRHYKFATSAFTSIPTKWSQSFKVSSFPTRTTFTRSQSTLSLRQFPSGQVSKSAQPENALVSSILLNTGMEQLMRKRTVKSSSSIVRNAHIRYYVEDNVSDKVEFAREFAKFLCGF
jgi:hypothetical protein